MAPRRSATAARRADTSSAAAGSSGDDKLAQQWNEILSSLEEGGPRLQRAVGAAGADAARRAGAAGLVTALTNLMAALPLPGRTDGPARDKLLRDKAPQRAARIICTLLDQPALAAAASTLLGVLTELMEQDGATSNPDAASVRRLTATLDQLRAGGLLQRMPTLVQDTAQRVAAQCEQLRAAAISTTAASGRAAAASCWPPGVGSGTLDSSEESSWVRHVSTVLGVAHACLGAQQLSHSSSSNSSQGASRHAQRAFDDLVATIGALAQLVTASLQACSALFVLQPGTSLYTAPAAELHGKVADAPGGSLAPPGLASFLMLPLVGGLMAVCTFLSQHIGSKSLERPGEAERALTLMADPRVAECASLALVFVSYSHLLHNTKLLPALDLSGVPTSAARLDAVNANVERALGLERAGSAAAGTGHVQAVAVEDNSAAVLDGLHSAYWRHACAVSASSNLLLESHWQLLRQLAVEARVLLYLASNCHLHFTPHGCAETVLDLCWVVVSAATCAARAKEAAARTRFQQLTQLLAAFVAHMGTCVPVSAAQQVWASCRAGSVCAMALWPDVFPSERELLAPVALQRRWERQHGGHRRLPRLPVFLVEELLARVVQHRELLLSGPSTPSGSSGQLSTTTAQTAVRLLTIALAHQYASSSFGFTVSAADSPALQLACAAPPDSPGGAVPAGDSAAAFQAEADVWSRHAASLAAALEAAYRRSAAWLRDADWQRDIAEELMVVRTLCCVQDRRDFLPPLLQAAVAAGPDSAQQRALLSLLCSCLKVASLAPDQELLLKASPVGAALSAGWVVMLDLLARPASPPGRARTTASQLLLAWLQLFGRACLLSAQQLQVCVDAVSRQQASGNLHSDAGSADLQLWVDIRTLTESFSHTMHQGLTTSCSSTGGLLPRLPPVLQQAVSSAADQAVALRGSTVRMELPVGGAQQAGATAGELVWQANEASQQACIDRMRALGSLLCGLPCTCYCSFSGCVNVAGASEAGLVERGSTVCSGCRCCRYCDRRCQVADWKGSHKAVCKALAAAAQQEEEHAGEEAAAAEA